MAKEEIEKILEGYGVSFTSALAERLCEEFKKEKAGAIDEFVEMLTNDWGLDIILVQSNKEKLKSFIVSNAEQLKEQE